MSVDSFCIFALTFLFFVVSHGNVIVQYNPGCDVSLCSNANLSVHVVYARYQEKNSSVHQLISTVGPSLPTVLLLKSKHANATAAISWDQLLSMTDESSLQGSVRLVDEQGRIYDDNPETAVFLFSEILGYSDISNNINIHDPKSIIQVMLSLNELRWNVSLTNHTAIFNGTGATLPGFSQYTWLALKFQFYETSGRDASLPRLPFRDQSAKLEVILKNFTAHFPNPRYAISIQVANPRNLSYSFHSIGTGYVDVLSVKSIDDEYAPSVFTTTQLQWKHGGGKTQSFYWFWRTVCYTLPIHTRKYSTDVAASSLSNESYANSTRPLSSNRLLLSYFGEENMKKLIFNGTIISFGNPDDKFYNSTNYISWTTLYGLGTPPGDSFSLMVICILLAGVACPFLVIVVGAIYYLVNRRRTDSSAAKSSYLPIS